MSDSGPGPAASEDGADMVATPGAVEAPPPAKPRVWTVFVAYLALWGASLLAGMVLAGVWLVSRSLSQGLDLSDGDATDAAIDAIVAEPSFVLAAMIATSVAGFLGALAPALMSPWPLLGRLRLAPIAARPGWLFSVLGIAALLCVSQVGSSFFALTRASETGAIRMLTESIQTSSTELFPLVLLAIGILAPIAEELLFRGYIQTRLSQRWGPWPAILVTSVLFGLLHFDPAHSPIAFVIGVLLGWLVERTGSLWPAMWAHLVNNLVFVVTARLMPADFAFTTHIIVGAGCLVGGLAFATLARRLKCRPPNSHGRTSAPETIPQGGTAAESKIAR